MNPKTSYILIGAFALVTVICLASAFSLSTKNKKAETEIRALQEQIVRMEAFTPDADPEPQIVYLSETGDTNELTVLKNKLAEQEELLVAYQSGTNRPPRAPRESFEERIAKMKVEDPEGYAEMVARREERQTAMRYGLAERTATFLDLDTSLMTEEERANHELLVAKMARVWELTDAFQDPEAAPDREAMRELFTEMRDVRPLLRTERTVMFRQLGTDLGYEGEDAENLATHIENIIDATNIQMPRGGGPRGGGQRGGGDGQRGGGGE